MSKNERENPFFRVLKRLKESFIATSQEADQLVREAESVCEPSSYDQKLEKKLNLPSRPEITRDSLDHIKADIEKFSQTLHETRSVGGTSDISEDSAGDVEKDTSPRESECAVATEQLDTNSNIEENHLIPPTKDKSDAKSFEFENTHSDILQSEGTKSVVSNSDTDIACITPPREPVSEHYTRPIADVSLNNSVDNNTNSQSLENFPELNSADNSCEFFGDIEKLMQQFAVERESIIAARAVFDQNVRSEAAVKIQTYWRGYHAKKLYCPVIQRRLETKLNSIIKLQSHYRRSVARKVYRNLVNIRDRDRACLVIQSWWRVYLAKNTLRRKVLRRERKERASTLLQSLWKMHKCRKEYLLTCAHRRNMISACVVLQSFWRGHSARKRFLTLLETSRMERRKQDEMDAAVLLSNETAVDTVVYLDERVETPGLESDSSTRVFNSESTPQSPPSEYSDCIKVVRSTSNQPSNVSTELECDDVEIPINSLQGESDIEECPGQEFESPANVELDIAHSLLEELRQGWLSRHCLWDGASSQQPLPPNKIPCDSIPSNAKPLTNSQLTSSHPSTPLNQTASVNVSESNHPVDLSCLQKVPSLLSLSISNSSVSLEGLQYAQKLVNVSVQHCGLSTANLKALRNVRFSDFSHNRISAVKGMCDFSRLLELVMNINRLVQLGEIKKCINLQKLEINSNLLVRGEGLEKLVCLLDLSCSQNHLSNIPQVSSCPLLQTVDLTDNNLLKYPALTSHPLLTELRLDDNSITDLDALAQAYLPSLQVLTLNGNSISTLVSFSALVLLERLELRLNFVEDLSALLKCLEGNLRLATLDMDGNPVTEEPGYRDSLKRTLMCLEKLDNHELVTLSANRGDILKSSRIGIVELVERQLEERFKINSEHSAKMKELETELGGDAMSIKNLLHARIAFCKERHDLAVHHLREHEYFGTDEAIKLLENKHDSLRISSAIVLQSCARSYLVRNRFRKKEVTSQAAVTIQKYWRGYFSRKCTRFFFLTRKKAAIVIQAHYKGWRVRSRLKEVLRSLGEIEDSDGEDFEELIVDNWRNKSCVVDQYELPHTPLGLYDDIIDSCIIQDYTAKIKPPNANFPSQEEKLEETNPHLSKYPLRENRNGEVDKEAILAWSSRNSSSATIASNLTEQSSLTDEKSWTSVASDKLNFDNPPPGIKSETLSPKDPWFLNNEQSITLFNKRAKKFKQGKFKSEEKSKLQDPLKRFEKLQIERDRRSYSHTSRATPVPRQLSSHSISSQSSGCDSVYKWSNTSGSPRNGKPAKLASSPPSLPQPSKKPDKNSFLPKLSSRVRAGYSPQLLTDFDTP